jgi:hypothetical protein
MRLKVVLIFLAVYSFACNNDSAKEHSKMRENIDGLETNVSYYSNNQIKEIYYKKDGVHEGNYKSFYPTGILKCTGQYEKGQKNGQWVWYDDNGLIETIQNMIKVKNEYILNNGYSLDKEGNIESGNLLSVIVYNDSDTLRKKEKYRIEFNLPRMIFGDGFEFIDGYDDSFSEIIYENDTSIFASDKYETTYECDFDQVGKYDLNFRLSQLDYDTLPDSTIRTRRLSVYYSKDVWVTE